MASSKFTFAFLYPPFSPGIFLVISISERLASFVIPPLFWIASIIVGAVCILVDFPTIFPLSVDEIL